MTTVPLLTRLARSGTGSPEQSLVQVLALLCEQLGLPIAVLGRTDGERHVVHLAVRDGARAPDLEGPRPAADSWCAAVPDDAPLVVRALADAPRLAALPATRELGVGCYVGTTVRDAGGRAAGVLGLVGHAAHTSLGARDLDVLHGLGAVVGELYRPFLAGTVAQVPAPRQAPDLGGLAEVVASSTDVETLARPLLDALHELSGIASTYLTVLHDEAGVQEIRYARNTKDGFALPEGLRVPWEDTLCKRALDEGRSCTTDVPAVWGDSEAGRSLGIVTYVSVPVRLADGTVWGTLCGADDVTHATAADHLPTLSLFARLLATEVERTAAVQRARHEAQTDLLTGCSTRRTVGPWLEAAAAALQPGEVVALAYVDVDRFKQVNDVQGHAAGDLVLGELGRRLLSGARRGDLVARLGGDEFVVAARLPWAAALGFEARVRDAGCFTVAGTAVRCSTGVVTAAQPDGVDALLASADAAMYRDKAVLGRR